MALLPTGRNDQYKLFAAVVFLAAAGLYWNFIWSPKNEALATMREHADSLKVMNQRAAADVASGSIGKLQVQADEYAKEVEIMRQLVPTSNEVPALLEAVSTAARRAGLELADFGPAVPGVVEGDQFDTYKYKLGVTGPYHKIADFLANVGSLRRIVAPINVTLQLSPAQDRSKDKTVRLLDAKFEIQTYVAHTAPGATPPKAAK